jgi:hypothetical protein
MLMLCFLRYALWRGEVADFVRQVVGWPTVLAANRCKTQNSELHC